MGTSWIRSMRVLMKSTTKSGGTTLLLDRPSTISTLSTTISKSFEIKALKSGAARLAIGADVPVLPTIVWGSQRIWTKGRKRDFRRNKFPISIYIGAPLYFTRETEVESAEAEIKAALEKLLREVQAEYPDPHQGQWWAPARLGGTAPTLEAVEREREERG